MTYECQLLVTLDGDYLKGAVLEVIRNRGGDFQSFAHVALKLQFLTKFFTQFSVNGFCSRNQLLLRHFF